MRYHYEKPTKYEIQHGEIYICNHPVYTYCTLFKKGEKGLSVIQQRFDKGTKRTYWGEIDPWLINEIYTHPDFPLYFEENASKCENGLYRTVTIRKIMWALRMKPLPKEQWETAFDRKYV